MGLEVFCELALEHQGLLLHIAHRAWLSVVIGIRFHRALVVRIVVSSYVKVIQAFVHSVADVVLPVPRDDVGVQVRDGLACFRAVLDGDVDGLGAIDPHDELVDELDGAEVYRVLMRRELREVDRRGP